MKRRAFLAFVAPSVATMAFLIALPLVGVVWLAVHQSFVRTELAEVKTEVPLFGGMTREVVRTVPQPVIGEDGRAERVTRYVGADNIRNAAQVDGLGAAVTGGLSLRAAWREAMNVDFWSALEFTLLYTAVTTPSILILGLALALGVNRLAKPLRGAAIFITLLPMIVTPVVSALSIYWLFLDGAVVTSALEWLGLGRLYFLADQATIRALIIGYGIWFAAPFAFILFYAGLQTVPADPLEAAIVDGANAWQRLRYVILPHLAPLVAIITLIHVMDAYRVFEPILVFGSAVHANSVQYLTYYTLAFEDNANKAAAYAILTVIGVVVILTPMLIRQRREYRVGR